MEVTTILKTAEECPLIVDERAVLDLLPHTLLTFSPDIYPLQAAHRALYWLADEVPLLLKSLPNGDIAIVSFDKQEPQQILTLQNKLLVALNDFTIRLEIEKNTTSIRERLIRAAFSEAMGKPTHAF